MSKKRLLTTQEVSHLFKVTTQRISQWVLAGRLRRLQRNGFDPAEVVRFAQERIRDAEARGETMGYLTRKMQEMGLVPGPSVQS